MTCCLIAKNQLDGNPRRSSEDVMTLDRLGALFPNRLSFSRTLVRRMSREKWSIKRISFNLNEKGIGTAIYKINTNLSPLWFVVFAQCARVQLFATRFGKAQQRL